MNPPSVGDPVTFRLPADLKARLADLAEEQERSLSWVIKRACEEYVDRADSPPGEALGDRGVAYRLGGREYHITPEMAEAAMSAMGGAEGQHIDLPSPDFHQTKVQYLVRPVFKADRELARQRAVADRPGAREDITPEEAAEAMDAMPGIAPTDQGLTNMGLLPEGETNVLARDEDEDEPEHGEVDWEVAVDPAYEARMQRISYGGPPITLPECFLAGQVAFYEHEDKDVNPHGAGTKRHTFWAQGWEMEAALATQDGERSDPRTRER